MAVARTQTFDQRTAIFGRLVVRNRLVTLMRFAVPALGAVALLLLVGQIWFANLARQYGVSGIHIDRGNLVVETPQYSGTGSDGTRYVVNASEAHTPLGDTSLIDMTDATLDLLRPGKAALHASNRAASVDTVQQVVIAPGTTTVASDDGLSGTLTDVHSDMLTEVTIANGPVDLTFPDGSHLTASDMHYDGKTAIWSFDRSTLVVPDLPQPQTGWTNVFALFADPGSLL